MSAVIVYEERKKASKEAFSLCQTPRAARVAPQRCSILLTGKSLTELAVINCLHNDFRVHMVHRFSISNHETRISEFVQQAWHAV